MPDLSQREPDRQRKEAHVGKGPRIVLLTNPQVQVRVPARLWGRALAGLQARTAVASSLDTAGDGRDGRRVGAMVADVRPDIVVAAGGDGTVSEVVAGLLEAADNAPALGILPFGTANNVARSLGLLSCRHAKEAAVDMAVATIAQRRQRCIDVGRMNGRHFVGSFAVGMDADILSMRNRYRQALGSRTLLSGYPLYLWSCAANLLRSHGGLFHLRADGQERDAVAYNLLVTNTALYAGEFRFTPGDDCDDGLLDMQVMRGPVEYVGVFVRAWQRHLRMSRGGYLAAPSGLRRVREVEVHSPAPVPCQLDGEELVARQRYVIRVVPRALRVCVPPAT